MEQPNEKLARSRFEQMEHNRRPYLDRGRQCASLTLPHILPPEGHTHSSVLPTPYQSLGARGVTNLASKLVLALFPPHQSFFSHQIDRYLAENQQIPPEKLTDIEAGLSAMERASLRRVEALGIRPDMHEAKIRALITGNAMLYFGEKRHESRVFSLDRYVVRRNASGKLMEFVTVDDVAKGDIPLEHREDMPSSRSDKAKGSSTHIDERGASQDDSYGLYTWGRRQDDGKWKITQEIEGIVVNLAENVRDEDLRFICLRYNRIDNESYGRGFVEQYLGDLVRLESLSKAIVEAAAASAKVNIFVNPNGITRLKDVQDAENLDVLSGRAEDVSTMQLDKYADLRVALEAARDIERRLEYAFLLNSVVQRKGDRVTAEEIRTLAEELENSLGGVYSLFSVELQEPLALLITKDLQRGEGWPKLPEGIVTTKIVTGIEALGRSHEGNKMDTWLRRTAEVIGPANLARRLNEVEYMKRSAASQGIDASGLIKTDEQLLAEEQRAQQGALLEKATGPAAGAIARGIMDQQQQ